MHRRVRCVWKNRAISALQAVNIIPVARLQIIRHKSHRHGMRPDPKQQGMIRFGTGRA
jgi:hypothetical protein